MLDPQIAKAVFNRDGWRCRHCNRGDTLDPHHVVYKSQGGADTLDNLITLCRRCHDSVHAGRLEIVCVMRPGFPSVNGKFQFWTRAGCGNSACPVR